MLGVYHLIFGLRHLKFMITQLSFRIKVFGKVTHNGHDHHRIVCFSLESIEDCERNSREQVSMVVEVLLFFSQLSVPLFGRFSFAVWRSKFACFGWCMNPEKKRRSVDQIFVVQNAVSTKTTQWLNFAHMVSMDWFNPVWLISYV